MKNVQIIGFRLGGDFTYLKLLSSLSLKIHLMDPLMDIILFSQQNMGMSFQVNASISDLGNNLTSFT